MTIYQDWIDAKSELAKAQSRLDSITSEILKSVDVKDEGSKTTKVDGYKVTTTQPIYRKVDAAAWNQVSYRIPDNMHPVKYKLEADAKGVRYLIDNEPDLWSEIAEAFTTTPGKIQVKVERMDK